MKEKWEEWKGCLLPLIFFVIVFAGAVTWKEYNDKKRKERRAEKEAIEALSTGLDEYIIIDKVRCAHSSSECMQFIINDSISYAVKRIDTLTITDKDYDYVCVDCIGNKEYKHLKRISERNTIIEYKPKKLWN